MPTSVHTSIIYKYKQCCTESPSLDIVHKNVLPSSAINFSSSLFYLSSCPEPIISDFGHRKTGGSGSSDWGVGRCDYGAAYFDTSLLLLRPHTYDLPPLVDHRRSTGRCSRCVRVRQVYVLLRLRRVRNGWAIEEKNHSPFLRTRRCEKICFHHVSELRGVSGSHCRAASDLCA